MHRHRMKSLIAVSVSLMLVVTLTVFLVLNSRDYEHFTGDTAPESTPVPQEVSGVAWEWEAPEGTVVREVAPGPAGPILLTEHGAIALDGSTGEELWGFTTSDPDGFDTRAGVTPGGGRTVLFQIRHAQEGAINQVTILDSATGQIDHEFEYRVEGDVYQSAGAGTDPAPDPGALSEHTWPEPTQGGLLARNLQDGDIAWEYTPAAGCSIRSQPYGVNLDPYTIASTADLYLVPVHCDPEHQDTAGHEPSIESTGRLIALDAATGEPAWPAITDVVFQMRSDLPEYGFRTTFTLDVEQSSVLVETTSGDRVFDLESGRPRGDGFEALSEEGYSYGDLTFLDSERATVITGYPAVEGSLHLGRMELSGGRIMEEAVVNGYKLFPTPGYHFLRGTDAGAIVLPLDNGVLVNGCKRKCGLRGYEDQPVTALFAPWGADGVEHAIDLPGFDPTDGNWMGRFMAVPGSVVAWQPHGQNGTTRSLLGLA